MYMFSTKNKSQEEKNKNDKNSVNRINKIELPTPIKIWKAIIEKRKIRFNN